MRIVVTKKDIEKARLALVGCSHKTASECAITQSVNRRFPQSSNLTGTNCIMIGNCVYPIPPKAQKFIQSFDAGEDVNPINFNISL